MFNKLLKAVNSWPTWKKGVQKLLLWTLKCGFLAAFCNTLLDDFSLQTFGSKWRHIGGWHALKARSTLRQMLTSLACRQLLPCACDTLGAFYRKPLLDKICIAEWMARCRQSSLGALLHVLLLFFTQLLTWLTIWIPHLCGFCSIAPDRKWTRAVCTCFRQQHGPAGICAKFARVGAG